MIGFKIICVIELESVIFKVEKINLCPFGHFANAKPSLIQVETTLDDWKQSLVLPLMSIDAAVKPSESIIYFLLV